MTRTVKAALLVFLFLLCGSAIFVTNQLGLHVTPPAPRQLFAVVEQYEAMIRRDCANLTGARRIEFGFVKVNGPTAVVQVFFYGDNGSVHAFLYRLTAEGNSWKINGVQPMRSALARRSPPGLHI
jgi:hypothetical protein